MSGEGYIPGDWWVLCDVCQRKVRSSKVTKRWDGLLVHADPNEGCWEPRHPQEFVRAVRDNFPLPFVRPDNEGLEPTLAFSCDSATFRWYDREAITEGYLTTIYKVQVIGPVSIPTAVTIVCTLEVE